MLLYILKATPFAAGPFWLLRVAIWGLGASFLATWGMIFTAREHPGDYFGTSGPLWATMGPAGRTRGGPELNDGKQSPSDWSCGGKALAFQIEGFGETGPGS